MIATPPSNSDKLPARAYIAEHRSFRILTSNQWMNHLHHCSSQGFPERPSSLTTTCENILIHMYRSLSTIFHWHLADPQDTNLGFTTFNVLFKRVSFVIAGTARYLSTTSIPPENMRLIHMPLIDSDVTARLGLEAVALARLSRARA